MGIFYPYVLRIRAQEVSKMKCMDCGKKIVKDEEFVPMSLVLAVFIDENEGA